MGKAREAYPTRHFYPSKEEPRSSSDMSHAFSLELATNRQVKNATCKHWEQGDVVMVDYILSTTTDNSLHVQYFLIPYYYSMTQTPMRCSYRMHIPSCRDA